MTPASARPRRRNAGAAPASGAVPALRVALALAACLALAGCGAAPPAAAARPVEDASIRATFDALRADFSRERAYGVVAYVERLWRWPGNPGFNAAIRRVAAVLDSAGYVREEVAPAGARLTYRIESRAMDAPTWEPLDASLSIVGEPRPLLRFATNRNMLAIHSFATPPGGVEAELVDVGAARAADFERRDVRGRVVMGDAPLGRLFRDAVQARGALGVLSYAMPAYTEPERYTGAIQFGSIPYDDARHSWGVALSYAARDALRDALGRGPVRVRVSTRARSYAAPELTLVAEARGDVAPQERFVLSAHVQEPGANDNASGVAALAELARAVARGVRAGDLSPHRTLTFIWGDEIRATRRFLAADSARAAGVRWGLALDMVGEATEKTGGTFLIEKMPDPSAVWTRGDDHHTQWGGGDALPESRLTPHYFNDVARDRCLEQARLTGWRVATNPFEGGSDHVPFLDAGKAGLLFWHFTDRFYHTDADRLDKVSAAELENAALCAGATALTLASADGETARFLIAQVRDDALERLARERTLGAAAVRAGGDVARERHILAAWTSWYAAAIAAMDDVEVGGSSPTTRAAIAAAAADVRTAGEEAQSSLPSTGGGAVSERVPPVPPPTVPAATPSGLPPATPPAIRGRGASRDPKNRFLPLYVERDPEWLDADDPAPRTSFLRDTTRSAVARNRSPDIGFESSVNPYRGCEHGCIYCYARPYHEYLGFSAGLDFETKILVKPDAPRLLREALLSPRWKPQVLAMSGVTDPYQPVERRLRITRGCLEVLAEFRNPVAIITKNHLVTRDADLLAGLAADGAAVVNVSVTSLDPELQRVMEPRTSTPARRLRAIEALSLAGVPVRVMVAPIIAGLTDHEVPRILQAAADAGAVAAGYTVLRLPYGVKELFAEWLEQHFPDRKEKVLNRVRSLRDGRLNDSTFGRRMRGEGPFAAQIRSLFDVGCRRAGFDPARKPALSTAAFRRPPAGGQLGLFEAS